MTAPNSYKDQYWADLSAATESKLGLPSGLLASVVSRGERSNADQVSEAGAKTPFQIIPETRKAALDKYGIDAYLSPENAAEVAGRLLKDSLDRNKGNAAMAVAEYHGGTDRSNWGPRTKSYVARVMAGVNQRPAESTFQRVMAAQQKPDSGGGIAAIYDAYRAGKMTPEESADFEADVKSGMVMLPRGASLMAAKPEGAVMLSAGVRDAYLSGQMTPDERAALESDMKAGLVKLPPTLESQIPTGAADFVPPTEQGVVTQQKQPTIGEQIIGAGEAALTTATGATGGAVGMLAGGVKGVAESILDGTFGTAEANRLAEQAAMRGAQSLTYEPRTEQGAAQAKAVGEALGQLVPLTPLAGEAAAIQAAGKAAMPAIQAGASKVAAPVVAAGKKAAQATTEAASRVAEALPGRKSQPAKGTMGSVGAAGRDAAEMRRANAAELGFEGEAALTEGQANRGDFGQVQFEREIAKNAELGGPVRERFDNQQAKARQVFESWVDETGAREGSLRGVGTAVDKALRDRAAREKVEIRTAYKDAEKAGEMKAPVTPEAVVDVLNRSVSAESTAPILTAARKELIRLGGAAEDANGALVAKELSLLDAEQLRKFVNKVTGADPTNIKFSADLKRAIDATTEGRGGELYAKAREMRSRYANRYENHAVIADLIENKRGTADRRVALEDVFDRIVFRGSLDDMRHARKIMQTAGDDGMQAWREIQGQAVRYIRDEATKGAARDANGMEMINAGSLNKAIAKLDADGKLDYLFGKRNAAQMRTLADVANVMFSAPPGTVNTSNTASVLLAALDMAVSGTAGVPLPIMSGVRMLVKNIKDRKIKARVKAALNQK